jgi:hypothetical protein
VIGAGDEIDDRIVSARGAHALSGARTLARAVTTPRRTERIHDAATAVELAKRLRAALGVRVAVEVARTAAGQRRQQRGDRQRRRGTGDDRAPVFQNVPPSASPPGTTVSVGAARARWRTHA